MLFDDPIEKGLLGPVALVTSNRPFPSALLAAAVKGMIAHYITPSGFIQYFFAYAQAGPCDTVRVNVTAARD